jgi:NDP-sugar pyrophosphorylase family protein
MKAVVLAGGEGLRLRPLTFDMPKPMVPIMDKPFMHHLVDLLARHGIKEVIFASGYKWKIFQDYFGDGSRWNIACRHVIEEKPLGTAGAVKGVEDLLGETFLVFNGDILTDMDLTSLIEAHRRRRAACTISLTEVLDPSIYGVVETDEDGKILNFREKPPLDEITTKWINAGVYVLEPEVLKTVPIQEKHSFERQLFPSLLAGGAGMYAFPATGAYWLDIGSPEKYLAAHHDVLSGKIHLILEATAENHPGILRGEGVDIEDGGLIVPPVYLGEGCRIKKGAVVGPLTTVGLGCVVEGEARVEGAVLWPYSKVGSGSRLKDCIVGAGCSIGPSCSIEPLAVVQSMSVFPEGTRIPPGMKFER